MNSNADGEASAFDLEFLDRFGESVRLKDFSGKKNVLLVVTRGFSGFFCPYCNAQTSRLIRNKQKFDDRDTEVIVVYPGNTAKQVSDAVDKPKDALPITIVLDENLSAVNQLMIKGDLAKPSTYILDKDGDLRFAYVGRTASDRPSLKAILAKLDNINTAETLSADANSSTDDNPAAIEKSVEP